MRSNGVWTLLGLGAVSIALGAQAGEPNPVPPAPASAWQQRCQQRLEAANREAAGIEREFARAHVQVETLAAADGTTREQVTVAMFPPTYTVPGFMIQLTRLSGGSPDQPGDAGWQLRAESLQGRYHATFLRGAPGYQAGFTFDGWASARVEQLAPIFKRAADACLEPPGLPAPAPAAALLEDPRRFDCRADADCLNSCAWGAVSAAWYARAQQEPGFSECKDGCSNQISAPPRCESGGCVAYQRDPRGNAGITPRPSCTRVVR